MVHRGKRVRSDENPMKQEMYWDIFNILKIFFLLFQHWASFGLAYRCELSGW